ncbi:MAG: cation diffusion facilitator family transporter [Nannocystaceae bacterium]
MLPPTRSHTDAQRTAERLALSNIWLSVLLSAMLGVAHWTSRSQLALAQSVDSFVDVVTSVALLWALRIANQPPDSDHPAGHRAAEPIAALVVAVFAGVMGVEVMRSAVASLAAGDPLRLDATLVSVFLVKVVVKAAVAFACRRLAARTGPAVRALFVDARNDVLAGMLAVLGYLLARYGSPGWDAWFALPIGAWIVFSGFQLARDNMRLLMGEAASEARCEELAALAGAVEGVVSVHDMVARHHGTHLDVATHVVLDARLSLREAHDIGDRVHAELVAQADIVHASVHLDVEDDRPPR